MKKNFYQAARQAGYAIGAFNVNCYDEMVGLTNLAVELKQPIILMASMSCTRFLGIERFVKLVSVLNETSSIPVYSHLDHCTIPELVLACAEAGFDSVMYDGSPLPLEENIQITAQLASKCHELGVLCEGELGVIAGEEGPVKSTFSEFTDPAAAELFARRTGVDILAVSIGNAHGFYKGKPQLQFGLLEQLVEASSAPLVLHGGTGIPPTDIQRAVDMGICKINVGTEIRAAHLHGVYDYVSRNEKGDVRSLVQTVWDSVTEAARPYMVNFRTN